MRRKIMQFVFVLLILGLQGLSVYAQEARSRFELLNLIRKDKFEVGYPKFDEVLHFLNTLFGGSYKIRIYKSSRFLM